MADVHPANRGRTPYWATFSKCRGHRTRKTLKTWHWPASIIRRTDPEHVSFFVFCFCLTFPLPPTKQIRQKLPPHPSRLLSAASLPRPLPPFPLAFIPPLPFPSARALGPLYTCIWTLCGALPCTRGLTPMQDQLEAPCPVADDPFQQTSNNRILGQSQGRIVCGKASVPPAEFLTFGLCLVFRNLFRHLGLDFVVNTFGRLFLNSIAWYFPAPPPLCLGVP